MIDKKNFGKLEELWKTIEDRAHTSSPEESYVSSLLSKGLKECAKKLGAVSYTHLTLPTTPYV